MKSYKDVIINLINKIYLLRDVIVNLRKLERQKGDNARPVRVIFKFFYVQIRFLVQKVFIFDWVDGIKMYAVKHRTGSTVCAYLDYFDYAEMMFLKKYLGTEDIFVDAGANVGSYSLFVANMLTNGKVYAFEPVPETYRILRANIGINQFDNVNAYRMALGDEESVVSFTTDGDTTNHIISNKEEQNHEFVRVRCVPLDKVVTKCEVIKIDVEGFELTLLEGSKRLFADGGVNVVIIEAFENRSEIENFMKKYNFVECVYEPASNKIVEYDLYDAPQSDFNLMFIRDINRARKRLSSNR